MPTATTTLLSPPYPCHGHHTRVMATTTLSLRRHTLTAASLAEFYRAARRLRVQQLVTATTFMVLTNVNKARAVIYSNVSSPPPTTHLV